MVAASVVWQESNSTGVYTSITNTNWGNTAAANITPAADYPIYAGSVSFEKWQCFLVTLNDAIKVNNFRVWKSAGSMPANASLYTSATTLAAPYPHTAGWTTPTATAGRLSYVMPTSEPGSANVSIHGTLDTSSGAFTVGDSVWRTDWIVHGIITGAAVSSGASGITLTVKYDEVV